MMKRVYRMPLTWLATHCIRHSLGGARITLSEERKAESPLEVASSVVLLSQMKLLLSPKLRKRGPSVRKKN